MGDPLPPALNIPVAVSDLRVVQRGDKLILDFTAPALTTEDDYASTHCRDWMFRLAIKSSRPKFRNPESPTHIELPARSWFGKEVGIRVVLTGPKGRRSSASNLVAVRVMEPLQPPTNVKAEPHPEGVRRQLDRSRYARKQVSREPGS